MSLSLELITHMINSSEVCKAAAEIPVKTAELAIRCRALRLLKKAQDERFYILNQSVNDNTAANRATEYACQAIQIMTQLYGHQKVAQPVHDCTIITVTEALKKQHIEFKDDLTQDPRYQTVINAIEAIALAEKVLGAQSELEIYPLNPQALCAGLITLHGFDAIAESIHTAVNLLQVLNNLPSAALQLPFLLALINYNPDQFKTNFAHDEEFFPAILNQFTLPEQTYLLSYLKEINLNQLFRNTKACLLSAGINETLRYSSDSWANQLLLLQNLNWRYVRSQIHDAADLRAVLDHLWSKHNHLPFLMMLTQEDNHSFNHMIEADPYLSAIFNHSSEASEATVPVDNLRAILSTISVDKSVNTLSETR